MRIRREGRDLSRPERSEEIAEQIRNRPRQRGSIRWRGLNGKLYPNRKTAVRRGGGDAHNSPSGRGPTLTVVPGDVLVR